jgi:hypothetical protein
MMNMSLDPRNPTVIYLHTKDDIPKKKGFYNFKLDYSEFSEAINRYLVEYYGLNPNELESCRGLINGENFQFFTYEVDRYEIK